MSPTTLRRAAVLAVVAASLSLPHSTEAAGGRRAAQEPGALERAWRWVAAWIVPETGERPGWTRVFGMEGGYIDPNGTNSAASPCPSTGCPVDPNG